MRVEMSMFQFNLFVINVTRKVSFNLHLFLYVIKKFQPKILLYVLNYIIAILFKLPGILKHFLEYYYLLQIVRIFFNALF